MVDRCPTCGAAVAVVTGDEGTSHYRPLSPSRLGRLRVGRKVGRTLYVQHGPDPSDDDVLVGMVDTAELAGALVDAYNRERVEGVETPDRESSTEVKLTGRQRDVLEVIGLDNDWWAGDVIPRSLGHQLVAAGWAEVRWTPLGNK